jgi:hypothetical protein
MSDPQISDDAAVVLRNKVIEREHLVVDVKLIFVILIIASVVGIIWIGLIAAWDHHDEPSHFQYIRRLIDDGRVPISGDENWKLNRQILKSMIWNGFFDRMNLAPVLPAPKEPVYFPGYSQYNEPPAYYYAASLVVRLLLNENITRQMFGARFVSLCFFLLTVVAAWGIAREITPYGHPLRWMLPLSITLFPTFVDIMTAVNNDSGSIAIISLFLWVCVRLIKRGFNILDFFIGFGFSMIAWYMKSTAALVLPLFPLAIIIAIFRGKKRVFIWALLFLVFIGGLLSVVQMDDAAFFYRSTSMREPTRIDHPDAVHGDWVLQLNGSEGTTPTWMPSIFQPIPFEKTIPNIGEKITLGFWMWADQNVEARTPGLITESSAWSKTVQLSQTPTFYTVEGTIDNKARLWLSINPFQGNNTNKIYLDGIVLAEGERPLEDPPIFMDENAQSGIWGGEPFVNMVRNGSAENASIRMRKSVDDLIARFYPDQIRPSFIIASILDWEGVGWYYNLVLQHLSDTFVGTFGWDHIRINQPYVMAIMKFLIGVGFVSALIGLVIYRRIVDWSVVMFMALAVFIALLATIPRGVVFLAFPSIYVPVARYIMPVMIPILLAVDMGWYWVSNLAIKKLPTKKKPPVGKSPSYSITGFVIFSIFAACVNLVAIINIWQYYGGYHLFM